MLNKVILKGKVGRAPKIFLTQEGKEVVSFSLATKTSWKDKSGEWQTATDWHQITVFRKSTMRWIKEGDPVRVGGKLTYQQWADKYGQPRLTSHVVVSGYGGKVECLKLLESNPQDNEMTTKTEQEMTPSRALSSLPEDERAGPPFIVSDGNSPSIQPSQDKGKTIYE
ncbi:MAG: single-stranded DNA-binding protein [Alphaproteobacteria bacterium]|nr:single-stranded DNA-binding protein [Alphaproteobacteria bacterium]